MTRHTVRELAAAFAVVALVGCPLLLSNLRAQNAQAAFPDLAGMLKASPGVLGVEAARTASGKQVIFAWFENKQALLTWYHSEAHQRLMQQFSGDSRRPEGPLTGVPDDGRPVMAIASITMQAPPQNGDLRAATTQIAIELYAPLPGGLAAGGRFAPSAVKVPGLLEAPIMPSRDTK